ncbi:LapA family protein [Vagococcus intermedius]|uniref:LapA family protein n=1 Tax=Vagococcus intermedius TaxID=2991418 RepID=A0AAF0I8K9_9ENTE|nr:LapA family protein [Vagococcus intermedius]WEG72647.1 LapA family protein [Vagococcus intermedius]WEG74732.1 LapA family protein [Vagococcus intermedius]
MKDHRKIITSFILVCIVVIFSVVNTHRVIVNFGFTNIQAPLIFIILGSTILGALIVFVTWFSSYLKQRKEIKRLKTELETSTEKHDKKMKQKLTDLEEKLVEKEERIKELENGSNGNPVIEVASSVKTDQLVDS